jgi:hypothetical protein
MAESVDIEALIRKVTDTLSAELRGAFAREYERGRKDAIQKIVSAAQEPEIVEIPEPPEKPKAAGGITKRVRSNTFEQPSTVPRGLPDILVRRVLEEHPDGISPSEITSHGKSLVERRISYSAIRKALFRGRELGKYKNVEGKWFCT